MYSNHLNSLSKGQETASWTITPEEETGDTFEAWVETMDTQALAEQATENTREFRTILKVLYLYTKRKATKKLI